MALFASQLISAASGSVGGLTFLPTRGGMALRAKAAPTNPNTPSQNVIRSVLAYVAYYWVEKLGQQQRHAWDTYAAGTPLTNRLGRRFAATGQTMFIRGNVPRLQAGLRLLTKAPTLYDLGSFTAITPFTAISVPNRLIFTFNNTDPWAKELNSSMLIYIARPKNQSIRFFAGPYRYAGDIPGSPFFPPVTPHNVLVPFPIEIGQKLFFRVTVSRADGRYSGTQRAFTTVT